MSWHIDAAVMDRYQAGQVDRVTAASLEAHVNGCGQCRDLVEVEPGSLDRTWEAIAARVAEGRRSLIERGLTRLGLPDHVARLVTVSPALRLSFLLGVAIVTMFAASAAMSEPTAMSVASLCGNFSGRTSARSARPMVFIARAAAPMLPGCCGSTSTIRTRASRDSLIAAVFADWRLV